VYSSELTEDQKEAALAAHEHPWLFGLLIAPDAVISLGLVSGGLTFLLRNEGVDPARAASIAALIALPHAIYFLWGPITDFWFQRRTWVMLAGAATSAAIVAAFHLPRLGSAWGIALLFLAASLAVLVPAASGGMMAELRSEVNRRRASSAYQTGSLAIGAAAIFAITYFAGRYSLRTLGFAVAAMLLLPTLAAFAMPSRPVVSEHTLRATVSVILRECKTTFIRWEAIPYTLIIVGPGGSGALIGLLPELARDYGVSGTQVAWINGLLLPA
jgi:PAT family beta-lactamase induction signal transducer AmpG